jgi:hypothetical protein
MLIVIADGLERGASVTYTFSNDGSRFCTIPIAYQLGAGFAGDS